MTRGRTLTAIPSAQVEGVGTDERRTRYGEQMVWDVSGGTMNAFASEGSYFVAMTATPGTAYNLAGATQTAFVATTPTLAIWNDQAAGGKSIYLDFMNIVYATAGSAGTRVEVAAVLDNIERYSSGGTALVSSEAGYTASTIDETDAEIYAGAITAAAAGAPKYVGRGCISASIPAVGETYQIEFGKPITGSKADKILRLPPLVIPPQHSGLIYTWSPSQSATPTAEVSVGFWMR